MADTARLHAEQLEYWKGAGGERWVAQQALHEGMLTEFGRVVLDRAAARPGENAIDIGCGCGNTSAELAARVGANGHVLALDVSEPILSVAKARIASFPNARTLLADAATYNFEPGATDLLFSRFGVMFFGDPTAAFANLRAAMKPTGRLVFACWRSFAENMWMKAPYKAVLKHVPPMPSPDPDDPGPFSFADADRVTRILTGAGFRKPEFEKFDMMIDLGGGQGIAAATAGALAIGPAARALADQPEAVRRAAEEAIRQTLAPYEVGDRVELPAAIWIVKTT